MKTLEQAAPVSAAVIDHELTEALQKYARIMREVGNESGVSWALETIRSIDLPAAEKVRYKTVKADIEAGLALQDYIATAKEQGRSANVVAAEAAHRNLHRNKYSAVYELIKALENHLTARIDAVAASIPKKK